MKHKTFEEFLKDKHAEDYHGTDDDMGDSFEHWVTDILEVDDYIALGDAFAKEQREELVKEIDVIEEATAYQEKRGEGISWLEVVADIKDVINGKH